MQATVHSSLTHTHKSEDESSGTSSRAAEVRRFRPCVPRVSTSRSLFSQLVHRELFVPHFHIQSNKSRHIFRSLSFSHVLDYFEKDDDSALYAENESSPILKRRRIINPVPESFLRHRSRIEEILSGEGLLFLLTRSGLCVVFDLDTRDQLCSLNTKPGEIVRTVFYHRTRRQFLTVSSLYHEEYSILRANAFDIADLRVGRTDRPTPVLEPVHAHGYIDFDEGNRVVLTVSCRRADYKIWDFDTLALRFSLPPTIAVRDLRVTASVLMVVHYRPQTGAHLPLSFYALDDGRLLRRSNHLCARDRIVFVELIDEQMLLKLATEDLCCVNVVTGERVVVPDTAGLAEEMFCFLAPERRLLIMRGDRFQCWSITGELLNTVAYPMWWSSSMAGGLTNGGGGGGGVSGGEPQNTNGDDTEPAAVESQNGETGPRINGVDSQNRASSITTGSERTDPDNNGNGIGNGNDAEVEDDDEEEEEEEERVVPPQNQNMRSDPLGRHRDLTTTTSHPTADPAADGSATGSASAQQRALLTTEDSEQIRNRREWEAEQARRRSIVPKVFYMSRTFDFFFSFSWDRVYSVGMVNVCDLRRHKYVVNFPINVRIRFIHFDEDRMELFLGDVHGRVFVLTL